MTSRKAGERSSVVTEKVKVSENVLNALIWMALTEEAKRGGGLMRVLAHADNLSIGGYPLLSGDLRGMVSDHDPKMLLGMGDATQRDLVLSRDIDTSVIANENVSLVEEDLFLGDVSVLNQERIIDSLGEVEQRLKQLSEQEVAQSEAGPKSIANDEAVVKTTSAEIGDIARMLGVNSDQITLQAIHKGKPGVMRVGQMLDIFPVMAKVTKGLDVPTQEPLQAGSFQPNSHVDRGRQTGRAGRRFPWLGPSFAIAAGVLGALLLTPVPFVLAFDPLLMRFHPDKVDPTFDGLPDQLEVVNARMANNVRWAVQVLNVAENSQLLADALAGKQSEVSPFWERHHRALLRSSARLLSAVADSTGEAVKDLVIYQDEVFKESRGNMLPFPPRVLASAAVAGRSFFHGMKVSGKLVELTDYARGGADINALTASFNRFARTLNY